jgi:hypothetical protein
MSIELKVKALSLAAETRIIKQQEQKCLKRSKRYYAYQVERIEQKLQAVVNKIRSTEETSEQEVERRILYTRLTQLRNRLQILQINLQKRQPSDKFVAKMDNQRIKLERHRIDVVRAEARATHIARGYIAGRTWEQMEGDIKKAALYQNWERVYAMVMRYDTEGTSPTARKALFDSWLLSLGVTHEEKVIEPSSPSGKTVRYQVFKKAA